jgi:hypothetical protein
MQLDLWTSSAVGSPASHGLSPESSEELTTTAISGRKCIELLPLVVRDGCLARTLAALFRTRWASTEFSLTWRVSGTPARRCVFRLVPRTRRTSATGFGSWPTPSAGQHNYSEDPEQWNERRERLKAKGRGMPLGIAVQQAAWPTPTNGDSRNSRNATAGRTGDTTAHAGATLSDLAFSQAAWPTPSARDHKSGLASEETTDRNARPLSEVAAWATPHSRAGNGTGNAREGSENIQTQVMAAWATPKNSDHRPGLASRATDERRRNFNDQAHGAMPNGSGASSTSDGGALNPDFVCWMLGYPAEWLALEP